jgi:hypothetical protein
MLLRRLISNNGNPNRIKYLGSTLCEVYERDINEDADLILLCAIRQCVGSDKEILRDLKEHCPTFFDSYENIYESGQFKVYEEDEFILEWVDHWN